VEVKDEREGEILDSIANIEPLGIDEPVRGLPRSGAVRLKTKPAFKEEKVDG
jgi:hypothetical protein